MMLGRQTLKTQGLLGLIHHHQASVVAPLGRALGRVGFGGAFAAEPQRQSLAPLTHQP